MKRLTTQQFEKLVEKQDPDRRVVNVLSEDQFRKRHIPGSVNVPLETEDFAAEVERVVGGKDAEVIVYCASEDCDASPRAAERLEQAGFGNVSDYEGGLRAWEQSGHRLEGQAVGT
jgi:rhodanese-related sulfurtransferase